MSAALFIYADLKEEVNSSIYRIENPLRALNRAGHDIRACHRDEIGFIDMPETVMIERVAWPDLIRQLRLAGAKRIIITFDDHYGLLHQGAISYNFWNENKRHRLREFRESLGMVDLAIVPSQRLIYYFGDDGPMRYVPNVMNDDDWRTVWKDRWGDPPVIGWAGSSGHLFGWSRVGLARALKTLEGRRKFVVHVRGGAPIPSLKARGVPFTWYSWVDIDRWPRELPSFDLGLAPLKGEYDECRSNLKAVEYALAGVPAVLSDSPVYADCPFPKSGDSERKWLQAIEQVLDQELGRDELRKQRREWAESFLASNNVRLYEEVLWPKT